MGEINYGTSITPQHLFDPVKYGDPKQLRMFVPAGEIHDTWMHNEARGEITIDDLYAQKLKDTEKYSLGDSFREHGIRDPIEVGIARHEVPGSRRIERGQPNTNPISLRVEEGHHRLALAYNKSPQTEVPISYYSAETLEYGKRAEESALQAGRKERRLGSEIQARPWRPGPAPALDFERNLPSVESLAGEWEEGLQAAKKLIPRSSKAKEKAAIMFEEHIAKVFPFKL